MQSILLLSNGILGILLLLVIILSAAYLPDRKEHSGKKKKTQPPDPVTFREESGGAPTVMLEANSEGAGDTRWIWEEQQAYFEVKLTDVKRSERCFRGRGLEQVMIGRGTEGVQVRVRQDNAVSIKHCKVFRKEGHFYIQDMDSANGTFVNGRRIYVPTPVFSGAVIRLGRARLILEIQQ